MKKFIVFLMMVFTAIPNYAQDSAAGQYATIAPESLTLAVAKTTNLIFPFDIKSVDRGSRDVLVQKAKGIENILQVKAGKECFTETNLTVITTEGKLYSYIVNHDESTAQLNLDYTKGKQIESSADSSDFNEAEIKALSEAVMTLERNIHGVKDKIDGVKLVVEGLFVHENYFFFKAVIKNTTNINYDISQLRLFIKDQKKSKRTASQENEIKQLYLHNPISVVKGQDEQTVVIAVPKFTIPDKKEMILQIMEKGGGRHLEICIRNKVIVKSKLIP